MKKALSVFLLLLAGTAVSPAQVSLGERVPNFSATDQDGLKWTLNRHLRPVEYLVIYFYPASFTAGCTRQACTYRDRKGELEKLNAGVVGVSGDAPGTLALFALQNQLNFTLLSDPDGRIAGLFGVPHSAGGTIQREIGGKVTDLSRAATIQRWTFILDRKGTLIYMDTEVNPGEDSSRVAEFLSSIEN
jgi:peroxiredoxin Q/BCP